MGRFTYPAVNKEFKLNISRQNECHFRDLGFAGRALIEMNIGSLHKQVVLECVKGVCSGGEILPSLLKLHLYDQLSNSYINCTNTTLHCRINRSYIKTGLW
jgi:hypothetical protein